MLSFRSSLSSFRSPDYSATVFISSHIFVNVSPCRVRLLCLPNRRFRESIGSRFLLSPRHRGPICSASSGKGSVSRFNEPRICLNPPPSLFQSWRSPQWLWTNPHQSGLVTNHIKEFDSLPPIFAISSQVFSLKLFYALLVTSVVPIFAVSYMRLDSYARYTVSNAVQTVIDQSLHVGRVSRCNPLTGIRLLNVELLPSSSNPTAPTFSAAHIDVTFSGVLKAIAFRRPLRVNVHVHRPTIRVSQRVVIGPKGLPIGQWDPGISNTNNNMHHISSKSVPHSVLLERLLRYLQPGCLSMNNALVIFQPADFQDYSHGSEPVHVKNTSVTVKFPAIDYDRSGSHAIPVHLRGYLRANVKGTPVEGGTISLNYSVKGDTLFDLQPGDVAAHLHVVGQNVRAARVASFLNLPFRADGGRCSGHVDMDFLSKSKSLVPIMRGEASLDAVGLRFHPDPKTPEFHSIDGKLRFEGKTLIMDGPTGELGSLPMSVVGNIHLEDGYDLKGYVRPVDVNNILDTFDVERFVPISGIVNGEARMTGTLEEPMISGWAESIGEKVMYDRLPLDSSRISFDWDAVAGVLQFPDIRAKVTGGGMVSGTGSMYFDMTQDSPYDIKREQHCSRNPKAKYWNRKASSKRLPAVPNDVYEIDDYAPYRDYDSMKFNIRVARVNGGELLSSFGGEYGAMASRSIGLVSGEAVIAGHLKDANCRVLWRSVSSPPDVFIDLEGSGLSAPPSEQIVLPNSTSKMIDPSSRSSDLLPMLHSSESQPVDRPEGNGSSQDISSFTASRLGGGDFNGLLHLKLGDPPEARRVKVRTIANNFDLRRAGWEKEEYRSALMITPLLRTSMDTFFKGVIFQREVLPPGAKQMPRTPQTELLGMDGALAVRKLSVNNVRFKDVLSGSFSFSTSDFAMSLKEVRSLVKTVEDHWKLTSSKRIEHDESGGAKLLDQISVSVSLKGRSKIIYRHGDSEIVGTLTKDDGGEQVGALKSTNISIQELFGNHQTMAGNDALGGFVDLNLKFDVTSRSAQGSIYIREPTFGPLEFGSIGGEVVWNDQDFYFNNAEVLHRHSKYRINAHCQSESMSSNHLEWNGQIAIPHADIRDVTNLIRSGNTMATIFQDSVDGDWKGLATSPYDPSWLRKLVLSVADDLLIADRWQVPTSLSASEIADWYKRHAEERKELEIIERRRKRSKKLDEHKRGLEIDGKISGLVTMGYNSKSGSSRSGATSGSALLQALLNQLSRTSFSFRLAGKQCRIGDVPIMDVSATGLFEEGIFRLGPLSFEGEKGFGAEAEGRVTRAGNLDGSLIVRNAPALLVQKLSSTPVDVKGECSGRLEVEGNVSNPRALGRMVWTDASLSGKEVRNARSDIACVNGRCLLNIDAQVGARHPDEESSDKERLESLSWGKAVIDDLQDLASRAPSKQMEAPGQKQGHNELDTDEGLHIQVSAPVRFYLLNYLRRRASSSVWADIEPVLGGSSPSDDEWIVAKVDIKKYGLVLLNTIIPEVGWEGGDSDVNLRVSGSLKKPVVSGRVSVFDGTMSPTVLEESVEGVKGEILIYENGLMTLKSISGRCAGKWVNIGGEMFLTEDHMKSVKEDLQKAELAMERLTVGRVQRAKKRTLVAKIQDEKSTLQRAKRGLNIEFGEMPLDLEKLVVCKLSGKLGVTGFVSSPIFGGSVTLADGVVFLGNAGTVGSSKLNDGRDPHEKSSKLTTKPAFDKVDGSIENKMEDNSGLKLDGLKISFGRNMKMVQSFLLNIHALGSVTLHGMTDDLDMDGNIRLVKGHVNLLASQMRLARGETSYVKFIGRERWEFEGQGGEPEMMMKVVLEDDNLLVRIGECKTSTWVDNIKVTDKEREMDVVAGWDEDLRPRLEELGGRNFMKRHVINSLLRLGEIGGKLGKLEWRLFPALLSREILNGEYDLQLREDIGGAGRIDIDGLSISAAKSVSGRTEGKILWRFGRWLRLRIGTDGNLFSAQLELFPGLNEKPNDD